MFPAILSRTVDHAAAPRLLVACWLLATGLGSGCGARRGMETEDGGMGTPDAASGGRTGGTGGAPASTGGAPMGTGGTAGLAGSGGQGVGGEPGSGGATSGGAGGGPGGGGGSAGRGGASVSGGAGGDAGRAGTGGAAGAGDGSAGRGGATASGGAGGAGGRPGTGGATVRPAILTGAPASHDYLRLETMVTSAPFTFTVTNSGGAASGVPSLVNSNAAEVTVTNNCTATLAVAASCTIAATFRPTVAGARSGTLTVSASPGGSVVFTLNAAGLYRLTVAKTGTGTVTSVPAGIACGATCSGLFPAGAVTLQARPTNGSNFRFAGWTGGGCSGIGRDCAVNVTATTSVTAPFVAVANNLVFLSSTTFATNLGNAPAYDGRCNAMATAAGINDAAGTGYAAFVSSSASLATARLGAARGWVRMDGRPFADTQGSLFTNNQVWNAILFDEMGESSPTASLYAMTGSYATGMLYAPGTCSNWTATAGTLLGGFGFGGPITWGGNGPGSCSPANIICMGKTKTVAATPLVSTGRKIWVSTTAFPVGGVQTPDALCQADRPAGVTTAVALLSTTTRAASTGLAAAMNYVRPDGTLVGTGAKLATGTTLESGVWQTSAGAYLDASYLVWTGSPTPATTGTAASTCGNWADQTPTAPTMGNANSVRSSWWVANGSANCANTALRLYCVQTAP